MVNLNETKEARLFPDGSLKDQANASSQTARRIAAREHRYEPWPQFFMAGASAGGAYYYYQHAKNPRIAAFGAAVAGAYAVGAMAIRNAASETQLERAYAINSLAGVALAAVMGPRAYGSKHAADVALASLGGLSGLMNMTKWYDAKENNPRGSSIPPAK